jgi:hypothetical protein
LFVERKTPPLPVPAKRFAPERARAETGLLVNPVLGGVQFTPLSEERKTVPFPYPARRLAPFTARAEASGLVAVGGLIFVHVAPLSVEREQPNEVPTKTFVPFAAREETLVNSEPNTDVQLVPLSVERNKP